MRKVVSYQESINLSLWKLNVKSYVANSVTYRKQLKIRKHFEHFKNANTHKIETRHKNFSKFETKQDTQNKKTFEAFRNT